MSRAPFQVLVLPYRIVRGNRILYAVFRREASTGGYWQGIAGGGEGGESPREAAQREALEEAGIDPSNPWIRLDSKAMIPVANVAGFLWGPDVVVIPEYCFGVEVEDRQLKLSPEHPQFRWSQYHSAHVKLHWETNKTALWELDYRLRRRLADGCS
jgi:dihydroneopterin triphosphate diphosphatase